LVDRLHELAIRVELQLSGGSIADTDGARVTIADERQRAFRRVACAVEPIQGVQPWQGPVGSRGGQRIAELTIFRVLRPRVIPTEYFLPERDWLSFSRHTHFFVTSDG
jgi:hypothetical protein